jgi:hypothetical protein
MHHACNSLHYAAGLANLLAGERAPEPRLAAGAGASSAAAPVASPGRRYMVYITTAGKRASQGVLPVMA